MCIILTCPANETIPDSFLKNGYENNPDSWGIMFSKNGVLFSEKAASCFSEFETAWKNVPFDAPKAVHFRIATHGAINRENAHPFFVNDSLALMHNGIIPIQIKNKKFSDTWHFTNEVRKIISKLPNALNNKQVIENIKRKIGYSKIVFMNEKGGITYVNKELGEQVGKIWASNDGYLRKDYWYKDSYYYQDSYDSDPKNLIDCQNLVYFDPDKAAELLAELLGL